MQKLLITILLVLCCGTAWGWGFGGGGGGTNLAKLNIRSVKCIGSSDHVAINSALSGGNVNLVVSGSCSIDSSLIVYSNTKINLSPNATITTSATSHGGLLTNYAATNPAWSLTGNGTNAGATMSSGGTTITVAGGSFTSADIGRSVIVQDAGPGGASSGTYILCAHVLSVTDGSHAVVDVPASRDVANVSIQLFDRDHDIEITGGTWTRDNLGVVGTFVNSDRYFGNIANGYSFGSVHQMNFVRADRVYVHDLNMVAKIGKYGVRFGDIDFGTAERLHFNNVADGVHVTGPARNISIKTIRGYTKDDSVAFTAVDGDYQGDTEGDIVHATVDDIITSTTTNQLKVVGGTDRKLRHLSARHIAGSSTALAVSIIDDLYYCGPSDFDDILVDGVYSSVSGLKVVDIQATYGHNIRINNVIGNKDSTSDNLRLIALSGNWDTVTIDGVTRPLDMANNYVNNVHVATSADINSLTINNNKALYPTLKIGSLFATEGTVRRLDGNSWYSKYTDAGSNAGNMIIFNTSSVTDSYSISNVRMLQGGSVISTAYGTNAPTVGSGVISGLSVDSADTVVNAAVNMDISVFGLYTNNLGVHRPISVNQGAAVVLRGSGVTQGATNPWWKGVLVNSGTFRCYNRDWLSLPPTVSAGTSPTVTGNNFAGTVVPGSGATDTAIITYYPSAFSSAPRVTVTSLTAQSLYVSDQSAGSFTVKTIGGGTIGAFTYSAAPYAD